MSNFENPLQEYRHSGVVPPMGAFWTLAFGTLLIPFLAIVYAFVIEWIPFIYANVLATMAYGFCAGLVVGVLWKTNHIRSLLFYRFAFLVFFVYAMYWYWAVSIWAKDGFGQGLRVFDPEVILAFGRRLFDEGSWGFSKNAPVKGWLLVAFWTIEALVVAGMMYLLITIDADEPFCENCYEWTQTEKSVAIFHATGREPEWQRLRTGDYGALTALPILTSSQPEYVRLDVASCPKCSGSNFMTLRHVKIKKDSDGDETKDEKTLLKNIILGEQQLQLVRELVERAGEAAADQMAAEDIVDAEELPPTA